MNSGKMSLKINTFCCFPLKFGLLIWGYFVSVFSAAIVLDLVSNLIMGIGNSYLYYYLNRYHITPAYIMVGAFLLIFTMQMIFHVILVVGLHKKSRGLLRAFYKYIIVMLSLKSISSVIVAVNMLINVILPDLNFWLSLNTFLIFSAIFFVEFYLVIAVHSYMCVLEEKNMVGVNGFVPSAPPSHEQDVESTRDVKFHLYSYNPYLVSNNDPI